MESNISHVPAITKATGDISGSVGKMRTGVDNLKATIEYLNSEVHAITAQVGNMTWQFRSLDPAVQHMGNDVNRMSGPMRVITSYSIHYTKLYERRCRQPLGGG